MPQEIYQHTFDNGLTLLAERMEHVRSAAVNFLIPAGCAYDPPAASRRRLGPVRPHHARRRRARQPRADARPGQPRLGSRRERRHPAHAFLGRHPGAQPSRGARHLRRHHPPAAPARRGNRRGQGAGSARPARAGRRAAAQGHDRAAPAALSAAAGPRSPRHRGGHRQARRRHHPQALPASVHAARHHHLGGRQHRMGAAARTDRPAVRRLEGGPKRRP